MCFDVFINVPFLASTAAGRPAEDAARATVPTTTTTTATADGQ